MGYSVVIFTEEDGVAIICTSWKLSDKQCYWPPFRSSVRLEKAVLNKQTPDDDWTVHAIRVLSETDSYERARVLLSRAEDESDLQTDENAAGPSKRRKRMNRKYISSDSDEDMPTEASPPRPPQPPNLPTTITLSNGDNTSANHPPVLSKSTSSNRKARTPSTVTTPMPAPNNQVRTDSASTTSRPINTTVTSPNQPRNQNRPASATRSISPSFAETPASPSLSQENATQRLIIKLLTEVKADIRGIKKELTHLTQQVQARHVSEDFVLPEDLTFPMTTPEDLQALELALASNKELERHMVMSWAACGGSTLYNFITRVFEKIVTNGLSRQINWTGQAGKISFKKLRMKVVLEKAVRTNPSTLSSTGEQIQREVAHYLKGSADREGGRKARWERAHAADNDEPDNVIL